MVGQSSKTVPSSQFDGDFELFKLSTFNNLYSLLGECTLNGYLRTGIATGTCTSLRLSGS